MIKHCFWIIVLGWSCLIWSAGLELDFDIKNMKTDDPVQTGKMLISGDKVSMRMSSSGHLSHTIFRGDKQLIWAIDDQKQEYTEIDKKTIELMGQSMNTAIKQMQEQLEAVPAEQRAMMEGMMKQQMDGLANAEKRQTVFKKSAEKKSISGFPCTKYDVLQGDEKVREMWVTQWDQMKNNREALLAFQSLNKFFKNLMAAFQSNPFMQGLDNPYAYNEKINGFPVLVTEFGNGEPTVETIFKSATQREIADDSFTPPKGYALNKPAIGALDEK